MAHRRLLFCQYDVFIIFFNFYSFILRERKCMYTHGVEAEREGERESQGGSTLSVEPDMGLHPRPELKLEESDT